MPEASSQSNFSTALSLLHHVYFNPIIGALVRCGVPDLLAPGPLPVADVAQRAGMDALSLTRALRALAAFGAFREISPEVFANSPVTDLFRNRPGGLRNMALFHSSDQYMQSAAALGHSIATGQSATVHSFGESFWEHMRRHPHDNEVFNRALAELRGDEHQQVAAAYDWSGVDTVVDVGGGVGSLLAAILAKQPTVRGVLIEQPEVLPQSEQLLSERGVRDRCQLRAGNFFESMTAVGEVWALSQVLHDWSDAECRAILRRCREAMRVADRLLVIEMLTVPCEPSVAVGLVDMIMLMFFGEARQRTLGEYSTLLGSTQFALIRVLPTASAFSIVEARAI
jgi:hypothetical protein